MKNSDFQQALRTCSPHFATAVLTSFGINLLYLALPLYMLQVYDRVLASRSLPTLVMLTIACLIALCTLAGLDIVRSVVLARSGLRLDHSLSPRVFAAALIDARHAGGNVRVQAVNELDRMRQVISGSSVHALLDAPWAPIYIGVIFLIHPLLGIASLISAIVLVALALFNQALTRRALSGSRESAARSQALAHASIRNVEVVQALGMAESLMKRWRRERNSLLAMSARAADASAWIGATIKFSRLFVQALILGFGAYLVIHGSLTAGGMLAAAIILGRALQPVEQFVHSWPQLLEARNAFRSVATRLAQLPPEVKRVNLPRPRGEISLESVVYALPGMQRPVLSLVTFALRSGETLGVVGPTAAGKSTLARLITGVLRPTAGTIRLDGAELAAWDNGELGSRIGYLPQDVELLHGSVADNISRFSDGSSEDIVAAAVTAGAHDMILALPHAYETPVGDGGWQISGGQRQRIALARAVYGSPCLVVLDEPNSNLDGEGEAALAECLRRLRELRTTVVIISHRTGPLHQADKVLYLQAGQVAAFGARQQVIERLRSAMRPHRAPETTRAAGS